MPQILNYIISEDYLDVTYFQYMRLYVGSFELGGLNISKLHQTLNFNLIIKGLNFFELHRLLSFNLIIKIPKNQVLKSYSMIDNKI